MTDAVNILSAAVYRKNMTKQSRTHPVFIFIKIRRKALLFLLGVLPLIISDVGSTLKIISAAAYEVTLLLILLLAAVIERENHIYTLEKSFLRQRIGVIKRTSFSLSLQDVSAVSVVTSPLLSLFKVVRITAETDSKTKKPELDIYADRDEGKALLKRLSGIPKSVSKNSTGHISVLITAASKTNVFSGLIFLLPLLQSLKKELSRDFDLGIFGELAGVFEPYTSYWLSFTAVILLSGWAAAFILNCFRLGHQSFVADRNVIAAARGIVTRHLDCVKYGSVLCFDMQTTVLQHLLGRSTLCMSYKEDREVLLLPAERKRRGRLLSTALMPPPDMPSARVNVAENGRTSWWISWAVLLVAGVGVWIRLAGTWDGAAATFTVLPFLLPIVWRLIISVRGMSESFLEVNSRYVSVCTVRCFTLHTVTAFRRNVEAVCFSRTPAQRNKGLCTVRIRVRGCRHWMKCRNYSFDRASAVVEKLRA